MVKHTPGPWTVEDALESREGEVWVIAPNAPAGRGMIVFMGDMEQIEAQDLGDAHLIAAAPDLLAACEGLVAAFKAEDLIITTIDGCNYLPLMQAYAAIAKAKNESEAADA